jgi:hypothetical protein
MLGGEQQTTLEGGVMQEELNALTQYESELKDKADIR